MHKYVIDVCFGIVNGKDGGTTDEESVDRHAVVRRSALVTGASRGIGFAIASRLAELGFDLTLTARGAEALTEAAERLRAAHGHQVQVVPRDSADREGVANLVAEHGRRFGSMDALVLNAGVGTAGPVESIEPRRVDKAFDVNFVSPLVMVQKALPMLRNAAATSASPGSRIIALASITGAYAEPGLAVYGASKAALLSLIETINIEESPNGVTATAIAPAFVDTDMSAWAADVVDPASMIPTSDVVDLVDMLLRLSSRSVISRIVMARAGTSGYCA
jgi:3-oxoacyl-[acyl-carrier protein] reductase